jgi:peptide/nickel transport system ATP-binding protein
MPPPVDAPLIAAEGVTRMFRRGSIFHGRSTVAAVADVSLAVAPGEVLGLIGESGSGKSTLGRLLLGLVPPTAGTVRYRGTALASALPRDLRRRLQIIHQNPMGALDPRMTVRRALDEPLAIHRFGNRAERLERVRLQLDRVGLRAEHLERYPHELSGGQRQRVCIARALVLDPEFVVADEPVSALDVSIQAQILNLLRGLQQDHGFTMLFVSHDLSVVNYIADRVAVMHDGRIVEQGLRKEVLFQPNHAYTRSLLAATAALRT